MCSIYASVCSCICRFVLVRVWMRTMHLQHLSDETFSICKRCQSIPVYHFSKRFHEIHTSVSSSCELCRIIFDRDCMCWFLVCVSVCVINWFFVCQSEAWACMSARARSRTRIKHRRTRFTTIRTGATKIPAPGEGERTAGVDLSYEPGLRRPIVIVHWKVLQDYWLWLYKVVIKGESGCNPMFLHNTLNAITPFYEKNAFLIHFIKALANSTVTSKRYGSFCHSSHRGILCGR